MATNWRTVLTQCPFYRQEDGKRIVCEGLPDKTTMALEFPSSQPKIEYKKRYCEKKYRDCPYAKILYQKWDK